MKHLHIPTFIIFGVSVFCISASHFDLANTIQYCWTSIFVVLSLTYYLCRLWHGDDVILPAEKMMNAVCVLGLFEILYAVLQLFGLVPDNFRYAHFSGSFNNPAIFGMLLSFCAPISVYNSVKSVGTTKIVWIVSSLLFMTFIFLSDSRTAILSSMCGISIVLLIEQKSLFPIINNRLFRTVGIVGIIGIMATLYFYKKDSADGRLLIWNVCLEMVKEKPWFGWGMEGLTSQYMNYQADYLVAHPDSPYILLAGETQSPFNEFLHVALVCGIPCALMFTGMLVWTVWLIGTRLDRHKSILLAIISVLTIWCLFSYPLNIPFVWFIILFIAISLFTNVIHFRASKIRMLVTLIACASCLYGIGIYGSREIRRVLIQDKAMECCDAEVMNEYEQMYDDYSDDCLFLYNYGALLHLKGEYRKSLEVFKHATYHLSDYNMMLLMGDDYQQLNLADSALIFYQRAGEMIPCRYLPLYYQMRLYQDIGEDDMAYETADRIIKKRNKLKKSKIITQIINEAKRCRSDE